MGWLGRRWRLALGVVTLAMACFVLVGTIRWMGHRTPPLPPTMAYPRIQQAAGVIDLLRDVDLKRRPAVLRAVDGLDLEAKLVDEPPPETPALRRAPRVEMKLREFAAPGLDAGLRAYINAAYPPRATDTEGLPVRIVWPTPDGQVLVLAFRDAGRPSTDRLLLPPAVLIGLAGLTVAVLALALAHRETLGLHRVAAAAETFDGSPAQSLVVIGGAPEVRRLAGAVQDMQQRVAALLQERSFLIGAISHDLKTYLTRIRLRAETLPEADQRERMASDLEAMTDLIDTSLAFARGTTVSQHKSLVDLADLAAVEAAERSALGQPVTLAGENGCDAVVLGDPVALRRVIANLVDNALKFGRGRVDITVEADPQAHRLCVDDDGPGVSAVERAAIFSPFYRIEGSRSRRTGGSGLGLAIARQIVEAHGGAISVGKSRFGGARFGVSIPNRQASS